MSCDASRFFCFTHCKQCEMLHRIIRISDGDLVKWWNIEKHFMHSTIPMTSSISTCNLPIASVPEACVEVLQSTIPMTSLIQNCNLPITSVRNHARQTLDDAHHCSEKICGVLWCCEHHPNDILGFDLQFSFRICH